ncbi:hypothetical protein BGW36DRAFT_379299 [Talaromyces proteolyticus]|uniref:Calcium uniporter protein, mitochondrial n=1 Tax=Talaromyces proteolyticus TaxID=1131652 RepID=A0AAD4KPZ1_9EURO|nr:uncharacterized protein BGW36DRAFT_379299 [Talaromyces proteolyticus]KAH8697718.1 hypothetical protein BGW36DRAFT_379299 [Talaromyces proteolyticus]
MEAKIGLGRLCQSTLLRNTCPKQRHCLPRFDLNIASSLVTRAAAWNHDGRSTHSTTRLTKKDTRIVSDQGTTGVRQFTTRNQTDDLRHESDDNKPRKNVQSDLEKAVEYVKDRQNDSPWQREGSQTPPVRRLRSASAMTKGKLLTTPSRLLKLILPVTTSDYNGDRKDVEPLALLLHPQQPLSYLERLIQAEVPPIESKNGKLRAPNVSFFAVEIQDETIKLKRRGTENGEIEDQIEEGEKDEPEDAGQKSAAQQSASHLRGGPGEGGVEMYGDLGGAEPEAVKKDPPVRWSSSTEIGDFIRDAARVKEFLVDIQGSPLGKIPVGVPSFNDRTYYLRMRLRKISKRLKDLAVIKQECDLLAHRGAQRVALGGLGIMVSWWYIVYKLTFETEYGWDTMEPITYLVSLSTLMGGYAWFLYHNREISYRSALDFTVNRRQQKLYQAKGIDLQLWESLIQEANSLRMEIKTVAEQYDVDWDETADEQDERVTEALKHERRQREKKAKRRKEDEDKETPDY